MNNPTWFAGMSLYNDKGKLKGVGFMVRGKEKDYRMNFSTLILPLHLIPSFMEKYQVENITMEDSKFYFTENISCIYLPDETLEGILGQSQNAVYGAQDLLDIAYIIYENNFIIDISNKASVRLTDTVYDYEDFIINKDYKPYAEGRYLEMSTQKPTLSIPYYIEGFTTSEEGFKVKVNRISSYNILSNEGKLLVDYIICTGDKEVILSKLNNEVYSVEEDLGDKLKIKIHLDKVNYTNDTLQNVFEPHMVNADVDLSYRLKLRRKAVTYALSQIKDTMLKYNIPIPQDINVYSTEKYKLEGDSTPATTVDVKSTIVEGVVPKFEDILSKSGLEENESFQRAIKNALDKNESGLAYSPEYYQDNFKLEYDEAVTVYFYAKILLEGGKSLKEKYELALMYRNEIDKEIQKIKFRLLHLKLLLIHQRNESLSALVEMDNFREMTKQMGEVFYESNSFNFVLNLCDVCNNAFLRINIRKL